MSRKYRVYFKLAVKNQYSRSIWFDLIKEVNDFIYQLLSNVELETEMLRIKIEEKMIT